MRIEVVVPKDLVEEFRRLVASGELADLGMKEVASQRKGLQAHDTVTAQATGDEAVSATPEKPLPIVFKCPDCGNTLRAGATLAGSNVSCVACNKSVIVPPWRPSETVGTIVSFDKTELTYVVRLHDGRTISAWCVKDIVNQPFSPGSSVRVTMSLDVADVGEIEELMGRSLPTYSESRPNEAALEHQDQGVDVLQTPVTDLEISVVARNRLKKHGIRTVHDIMRTPKRKIEAMFRPGGQSVADIEAALKARGVGFAKE